MSEKDNPLVSIVVPSYNQGAFVRQTIESCLEQDYRPIEIIVMDGASTDNTVEVLESFGDIPELNWISEPDDGVVDAVNKGLKKATGEIAAIQSSDDYYLPGCFSQVVDAFQKNSDAGLVFGDAKRVDADGRELALDIGGWNPEIPYVPDADLWMRLAFHSKVIQCSSALAVGRRHPDQRDTNGAQIYADYLKVALLKFRYGGPWTNGQLTRAAWVALLCRPSLIFSSSIQKHRFVPGYFRMTEWVGSIRRAISHSRKFGWVGFLLLVALSRLPWIATGYGTDPDSHRVVLAAQSLAGGGGYEASRFPGNPVHEGITSLVIRWGPMASNGLSALFSILGTLWLALLARSLGVRHYRLLAIAFAFTSVVYVASVSTVDYVWAAALMIGGFYCAVRKRVVLSGVLMGLAIGCRITSGMMLLPLAWYWIFRRDDRSRLFHGLIFLAVSGLVGLLCYLPGLHRYGLQLLSFYENGYPPLRDVIINGTVGVWGTLGVLVFMVPVTALVFFWKTVRARLADGIARELVVCCIAIILCFLAYLRLPHEAGYLIPLVPFVLLFVGCVLPHRAAVLFFLMISLSPFITIGRSGVHQGQIIQDHNNRLEQEVRMTALIKAVEDAEAPCVIVAGEDLPAILTSLGSSQKHVRPCYEYLVPDRDKYDIISQNGRCVYILPRARLSNLRNYNVDLVQCGAVPLAWEQLVERGSLP